MNYKKILTNCSNEDGVREEQAVVDFGEFEPVASEPVRHLRLTFIPIKHLLVNHRAHSVCDLQTLCLYANLHIHIVDIYIY